MNKIPTVSDTTHDSDRARNGLVKSRHKKEREISQAAPSALKAPHPAQPESSAAILHALATASPDWSEIALITARDPVLCLLLLAAAPLAADELDAGLNVAVRQRLTTLGADLLRAWLLGLDELYAKIGGHRQKNTLLTAECALHLAIETHYPRPDEAYLGGLWSACAASRPNPANKQAFSADQDVPPFTHWVRCCGLPETLIDALELGPILDEQVLCAHPLVRLLKAAQCLADDAWETQRERVCALTGLSAATLSSLRTDVGYIVAGHITYPPVPPIAERPALTPLPGGGPLHISVLHGLIAAAFTDLSPEAVSARLALACPLFIRLPQPILLAADQAGFLKSLLPTTPPLLTTHLAELHLREDDEASCIALAMRSGKPTGYFPTSPMPGRSTADWHIARWLGRCGFCCLPLSSGEGGSAVAVVGLERERDLGSADRWLLSELLAAAARTVRSMNRQHEHFVAREAALHTRFREHLRRVAHEATNPLTILKTRLGMLGLNQPEDSALHDEMQLLNTELDRIGNLLRYAAELPADEVEAPRCRVADLLRDMRAAYSDVLFSSRGIVFELHTTNGTTTAAIPASTLKQVLLNLLRNASEAMQPGGKLSVWLAGPVIVDGRPCAEIQITDNGPGLSADRAADLFSPRPSAKGGNHQGVGLAVVHDLLAQWGGLILCRSQIGAGTSFELFIPLDQPA